jgi:hypothetical protein
MSSSSSENYHDSLAAKEYKELSAAAAKIGMRLVSIDSSPESDQAIVTSREDLLNYASDNQVPKAVAFRGWRRLQELYTAKVQFETFGIKSQIPFSTPLRFINTPPLPFFRNELPESWVAWRQTLTDLDGASLQQFVVQLDNAESRFGRNPQADLLGKGNGTTMFNLLKGFAEQVNADYSVLD